MDVTPIYELRTRLRAAAIAGTNLLSEDFRLKKAVEGFSAMKGASPVFAKINELSETLISDKCEDKAGTLLDTITLVDSVICTLGTVEVSGDPEDIELPENPSVMINAPYSVLSGVIDALTTSGSGKYNLIDETYKDRPEIFNDYRVKPALVEGLGASYAELAFLVENILEGMGRDIVPLLKKDFDPKGKKEMLRRLGLIERLCGADENDFYLEQLENSEKDIRKNLVYALRFDKKNVEKLMELTKTEKGKIKDAAFYALASLDCEESEKFFGEFSKKKPEDTLRYLAGVTAPWASKLTARLLEAVTTDENGKKVQIGYAKESTGKDAKTVNKLVVDTKIKSIADPLIGKYGAEIEEFYKNAIMPEDTERITNALGASIILTNDEGLKKLAFYLNKKYKGKFLYAETIARLYSPEDCTDWLESQLKPLRKSLKSPRDVANNEITRLLWLLRHKDGKYGMEMRYYNAVKDEWLPFFRPFDQPVMPRFVDLFIKLDWMTLDEIIARFYDPEDADFTAKYRVELEERMVNQPENFYMCCNLMNQCGFMNIKGLAARYFKKNKIKTPKYVIPALPGTQEYKAEEAREVIKLMRSGEIKYDFDLDDFEAWLLKTF